MVLGVSSWHTEYEASFFGDENYIYGRVRILIKTRLKINFDRFTMGKMSNFIFNRVLISIRTRPM